MRGIKETQEIKLGDAPEGIPSFVFNIIGNLTWDYIFIRHMICVLLGASFYFVYIFFCYLGQSFVSFTSIKMSSIAFTMLSLHVHEWLFQNRKFAVIAKNSYKIQNVIKS